MVYNCLFVYLYNIILTFRKLAGYLLHRVLGELTETLKRKQQQSFLQQKRLLDMKEWVQRYLISDRTDALSHQGVDEVEFNQNERFSLKHVTDEFFFFVRQLDEVWCKNFQDNDDGCILKIQNILLTSDALKGNLYSISGHLSGSERESKFLLL